MEGLELHLRGTLAVIRRVVVLLILAVVVAVLVLLALLEQIHLTAVRVVKGYFQILQALLRKEVAAALPGQIAEETEALLPAVLVAVGQDFQV
jgi:hypothetical protein